MMSHTPTQTPIDEPSTFNYTRCANLHNEILRRGLEAAGYTDLEAIGVRSWWDLHNPSDDIAQRLSPPLIEFLKLALYVPQNPPDYLFFYFFYYLSDMIHPDGLFDPLFEFEDDEDRYVLLYRYGFPVGHTFGLFFDQWEFKAAVAPSIWEVDISTKGGYGWQPLDAIFEAYLDMLDQGKVSLTNDKTIESPTEVNRPWVFHSYSQTDVDRTVAAFSRLIDAIDSRLPPTSSEKKQEYELPWAESSGVDDAGIAPNSFARAFFSAVSSDFSLEDDDQYSSSDAAKKTRRPRKLRFRYVAPGLRLPTKSEFSDQPFRNFRHPHEDEEQGAAHIRNPYLLVITDNGETTPVTKAEPIFNWPYSNPSSGVTKIPAGLYLNDQDIRMTECMEDSARLVLPFGVGKNGYARTSEGAVIGNELFEPSYAAKGEDRYAMLYQTRNSPFFPRNSPQLYKILDSWADRVESGDWTVGKDGVEGGIDMWREADTETGWRKYFIPLSW